MTYLKDIIVVSLRALGLYRAAKLARIRLDSLHPQKRAHKRQALVFYSQFIKRGDLCFDIGAHVGNRTEILLGLGAKVVAVEPLDNCMDTLRIRYGNNPKVILINKGLADSVGTRKLLIGRVTQLSTMSAEWMSAVVKSDRFKSHEWNESKVVTVTTLDELIASWGLPVLCKIDVEGLELQVLKGLSQPVPYLSFEFTPEYMDAARLCIDHLSSLGSAVFNYSISESMRLSLPDWVPPERMYKCLDDLRISYLTDRSMFGDIYASFV